MYSALIIDDEEIIRRTIRRIGNWEAYGIQVAGEAENGLQGLEMIERLRPDIAFLDMRMPGLMGTEVIEALLRRDIRIKLVVISGFDSFEYSRMALRYGALDYLLKPIERGEFNAVLKRLQHVLDMERGSGREAPAADTLEAIRRHIERDCCAPLTLESLASEYFLNKEYLSRAFKKRYDIGITALIHTKRMEIARTLLAQGYKVGDAAESTGYGDVNYFGRVFRKYVGTSPSEYSGESHRLEK